MFTFRINKQYLVTFASFLPQSPLLRCLSSPNSMIGFSTDDGILINQAMCDGFESWCTCAKGVLDVRELFE